MSDQKVFTDVPQQWNVNDNKNKLYSFNCKNCGNHYEYESSLFIKDASVQVPEITKTDQVVRISQDKIFPFIAAIGTYYVTHQWYNPPGTNLFDGALLPAIVAISTYIVLTMTIPMLFGTGSIPIYYQKCSGCQMDLFFAAGKSKFGLPNQSSEQPESRK